MADFGLVKSFHIDNGELDGNTEQECFVLGYELALIDQLLKTSIGFSRPVHAANQDRIKKSCVESNRLHSLTWLQEDVSESWLFLEVASTE